MKRLTIEKRAQIISALVEGNSLRSVVRMTGAAMNTVLKLLAEVGAACSTYQKRVMRDLPCKHVQCDEIWQFCYAKDRNVPADNRGKFGFGDRLRHPQPDRRAILKARLLASRSRSLLSRVRSRGRVRALLRHWSSA